MILEVAPLDIRPGTAAEFEAACAQAESIIVSMHGYISHELLHCLETEDRYLLLVCWETVDEHTEGFRKSPQYAKWKALLHHFYDPFPTGEHYEPVSTK